MNYGKKKKMKDGGMARKVHDATMRAMKDIDPADYSKSVKNFKKDYDSVSKKIKESMKTGKSGMKAGGMAMKDVPMDKKKSLGALPEEVRNKMGFNKAGGKVKKMAQGGSTSKRKVDPNLTLRKDVATQAMKKAAKTGAGLGAAIAKVKKEQGMKKGKKKQAKDKSPKGFRGDPNKDGTFKKGGLTKKESQSKSKRLEDFAATAFQPKTPKERKAAAIDKVKRENKSQSNQERKKESSRKLKEIQSKLKPGMPMFKKGGMAKKKMMGGGMAMKYKHGGKVGKKCPRDGIARKGKTRA